MSKWFSWHFWASEDKIKSIFNKQGYNVQTVRCYLKREFGYKNGKEIIEDLEVKKSFLDACLVYKDSEVSELNERLSDLINFLRDTKGRRSWGRNVYALRWNVNEKQYDIRKTVGRFEMKFRLKEIIGHILEIDVSDC